MTSKNRAIPSSEKLLGAFTQVQDVGDALAQYFIEGDFEGFQDILTALGELLDKLEFGEPSLMGRNTLCRSLGKKDITIKETFEILEKAERLYV